MRLGYFPLYKIQKNYFNKKKSSGRAESKDCLKVKIQIDKIVLVNIYLNFFLLNLFCIAFLSLYKVQTLLTSIKFHFAFQEFSLTKFYNENLLIHFKKTPPLILFLTAPPPSPPTDTLKDTSLKTEGKEDLILPYGGFLQSLSLFTRTTVCSIFDYFLFFI